MTIGKGMTQEEVEAYGQERYDEGYDAGQESNQSRLEGYQEDLRIANCKIDELKEENEEMRDALSDIYDRARKF